LKVTVVSYQEDPRDSEKKFESAKQKMVELMNSPLAIAALDVLKRGQVEIFNFVSKAFSFISTISADNCLLRFKVKFIIVTRIVFSLFNPT
jgi:hypothetical protein